MRISDWSSDVCSSDLTAEPGRDVLDADVDVVTQAHIRDGAGRDLHQVFRPDIHVLTLACDLIRLGHRPIEYLFGDRHQAGLGDPGAVMRSEEHTSELQSPMRISYAVFCT